MGRTPRKYQVAGLEAVPTTSMGRSLQLAMAMGLMVMVMGWLSFVRCHGAPTMTVTAPTGRDARRSRVEAWVELARLCLVTHFDLRTWQTLKYCRTTRCA
jgi:hypothetical protein